MNAYRWRLSAVITILVYATASRSEGNNLAEMWKQVQKEAEAVARGGEEQDYGTLQARFDKAGKEIAERSSRADVEAVIRSAAEHLERAPLQRQTYLTQRYARAISIRALLDIADPKGDYACGWSRGSADSVSWYGASVAAVDTYHDARSRDLLLELALKEELSGRTTERGGGSISFASPVVYALGFLRSYQPEKISPKIEITVQQDTAREKPKSSPNAMRITRADYMRALLESWKYAAALAPPERDRYRDFERRLWRAWAMAGGWGDRKVGVPFESAASTFDKHRKDGDEHFLLRIFEEPTSTIEETRIAEHLAYRLSSEGKKQLEKLAKSDSIRASFAAAALKEATKRRSHEVTRDPEH